MSREEAPHRFSCVDRSDTIPWDAREITDSAVTHVAAQRLPSKIDTVLERKEKENTSSETKIQNIHFPLFPVFSYGHEYLRKWQLEEASKKILLH